MQLPKSFSLLPTLLLCLLATGTGILTGAITAGSGEYCSGLEPFARHTCSGFCRFYRSPAY